MSLLDIFARNPLLLLIILSFLDIFAAGIHYCYYNFYLQHFLSFGTMSHFFYNRKIYFIFVLFVIRMCLFHLSLILFVFAIPVSLFTQFIILTPTYLISSLLLLGNSMAYRTQRFNAAFTRDLQ